MLKWDALPQYKTLRAGQRTFAKTDEQVVVDLSPAPNERHLLVRLKDEVTSKKTLEKRSRMKVVEKVVVGESKSSSDFDNLFDADYLVPLKKVH